MCSMWREWVSDVERISEVKRRGVSEVEKISE